METLRYVVGVLLVIGVPPGLTWWFIVHPFIGFWRRIGVRMTMAIMVLYFAVGVAGLLLARDWLLGADLGTQWSLIGVGVTLMAAAAYVGWKRRKYLTTRVLVGIPELQRDPERQGILLDQGPYALIRHPRYVEIALAVFAYAAIANYVGAWIMAVLSLPVLHLVVLVEEQELADRFGEAYLEYADRVPRYMPKR